jgi:putative redox protein
VHPAWRHLYPARDIRGERVLGGRVAMTPRRPRVAEPVSGYPPGRRRRTAVSYHLTYSVRLDYMTTHRSVIIERTAISEYTVTNSRNTQIRMGSGDTTDFTPVELLLAAIGGCTAVDVDLVTSRRAEPDRFDVEVGAEKVNDPAGNHLSDVTVTFRIRFPEGEGGDKARSLLPGIIEMSHDRLCTVGVTVEHGTPITTRIE